MSRVRPEYDDDFFAPTRMSFGDHLEELRFRLLAAIKGLVFFLVIGFVLDGVGDALGFENFGVGRPILKFITSRVEEPVKEFYRKRNEDAKQRLDEAQERPRQRHPDAKGIGRRDPDPSVPRCVRGS